MQLYALDDTLPIIATHAKKEKRYLCPECKAPLKVRSGPLRQPHFYHLRKTTACRQSAKSEEHLYLQLKLLALIGETAQMESPFPSIGRIADLAWHERKILFEIQCSPISLEEAQQRCLDYKQVGYDIIWVLHDKRFNQKNLSAAELYLREVGSYFTDVNKIGKGEIYDQFEVIKENRRLFKGPKLPINPVAIAPLPQIASPDLALPKLALKRLLQWTYLIEGDLLHRLIQEKTLDKTAQHLLHVEEKHLNSKKTPYQRLPFITLLAKGYLALLHLLLKKL